MAKGMAKRKHSLEIEGPSATAKRTIERLADKAKEAQTNPALRQRWESKYYEGIASYANNEERRETAQKKLSTWYEVVERNVAPEFSRVMMKARARYHKRLAEKFRQLAQAEEESGEAEGEEDDLALTF